MNLHFKFEVSNKTCCSSCRCYGDPHCESFEGKADTWVICDARNPKPGNIAQCPMSKAVCENQIDHTGNPCHWTSTPAQRDWSIALMGSPCRANQSAFITPPQMSMYKSNNFNIILNQGERSIIQDLIIQDGNKQYVLGAQECFNYAYNRTEKTAWRTDYGIHGTIPASGLWLPMNWSWSPIDGQDILWEVTGLDSLIDVSVRCTRTPERVGGKIKYGPPRLNVEIVEPMDWHDIDRRPNVSGFCPDGAITKQGSTGNTDRITEMNACNSETDNLLVAQALCGEAVTTPGVPGCMQSWCRANLPLGNNLDQQQQCISDIQTYGWSAQFCALNVFGARSCTSNCTFSGNMCKGNLGCRTCMSMITDDGWAAAITKYGDMTITPSDEDCTSVLRPNLIGAEKGVRIQYFEPNAQIWITKYAIPSTMCLKGGFVTFNKDLDPELFYNPIRLLQCANLASDGLGGKCSQEIGFKAHIEVTVTESKMQVVNELFDRGDLICNPQRFPSPDACFGDYVPEKTCPCPT